MLSWELYRLAIGCEMLYADCLAMISEMLYTDC